MLRCPIGAAIRVLRMHLCSKPKWDRVPNSTYILSLGVRPVWIGCLCCLCLRVKGPVSRGLSLRVSPSLLSL